MDKTLPKRALIVADPWIGMLLSGEKTWEMRSRVTRVRGRIALIRSGTGLIVGEIELVGCLAAIDRETALDNMHRHRVGDFSLLEKWKYPWVMKDVQRYETPVPYSHPRGAITWVRLDG